jgi:carboxyl-terminal processing protease
MTRVRTVFVGVSLLAVLCFASFLVAAKSGGENLFRSLGNLAEVVHLVETDYVDELNPEALSLALDAGIVESVDPWAAVVPTSRIEQWQHLVDTPPAYGLVLATRLGSAAVRAVIPGSPADTAGLETWEVIEQVEGVYTRGRPMWQIRLELAERQRADHPTTLTVLDRQVDKRREVVLDPTPWTPPEPVVEDRDDVRVVRLEGMPDGTAIAVAKIFAGREHVVLDLRSVAWGRDQEAVMISDLYAGEGILAEWQGRKAGSKIYEASPGIELTSLPVVLVSAETEGPGEILAAALQRLGATLVGSTTIGHAPHMQFITDGDMALWIPVGRWLGADGEPIHQTGVEPGETVEVPETDDPDADPALDRALELASASALEQAA